MDLLHLPLTAEQHPITTSLLFFTSQNVILSEERIMAKGGRGKGAKNYTDEEISVLMELIEENLPIESIGWDRVASEFAEDFDIRTRKSLKIKFESFVRATPNTGDPDCPEFVRTAKRIQRLLLQKSEGLTGEELVDANLADSDDESEEEEDPEMSTAAVARSQPKTARVADPPNDSSIRIRHTRQSAEKKSLLKDIAVLQMEKRQKMSDDAMRIQQQQFQQQKQLQMKQKEEE